MTKLQEREIYFEMYCVALGLAMMRRNEVYQNGKYCIYSEEYLPGGMCWLLHMMHYNFYMHGLKELKKF